MSESIAKARMRHISKLLDRYRLALKDAGAPEDVTQDIQRVSRYLMNVSIVEATSILKQGRAHQEKQDPVVSPDIKDLALAEVFNLLRNEKVSRRDLEAVAVGRFGVPRGSLSSFSNLQLLKDKISTLARNEQAHNTISEVAKHTKV